MMNPAAIASLFSLVLGLAQASTLNQTLQVPRDLSFVAPASDALGSTGGYDCYPNNDQGCYKDYWGKYKKCHPYDKSCYRDCDDYDDYTSHCKNYDRNYGKCYDRCYYDYDGCDKYKDCHKDEGECYKKKRKEHRCRPDDTKCRKSHPYPPDFCKPWDWGCHKEKHDDKKDYECRPQHDRDCYPDFPDYPDYDDHDYDDHDDHDGDDGYHKPKGDVHVWLDGPDGRFDIKIWPDGDENWTDRKHEIVREIKYYGADGDDNVRCLPMKSWFPWTPLPLEIYKENEEYNGKVIRTIKLKYPQPVEVLRCDFP